MKKEKRNLTFKDIEVRSSENENKKIIEGIIPYNSKSAPIWGVTEIISPTAFNKTLADGSEVRALFNHDDNKVLGSTKSGTLVLENTETGLIARCELPQTSYANDLYEIISRGDVTTMSFGFIPQKWEDSDNGKKRTLKEVQLLETSFGVAYPAYPETTSVSYMRGLEKNNINIEKLNEVLEKDSLEETDKLIISDTVNSLRNILGEKEAVENEPVPETTQEKEDTSAIEIQIEAELQI